MPPETVHFGLKRILATSLFDYWDDNTKLLLYCICNANEKKTFVGRVKTETHAHYALHIIFVFSVSVP